MSVTINGQQLRRELARRGWSGNDLARAARVSHPTVSAACRGKAISPTTLRLIVEALMAQPTLPEIDGLLR